MSDPIDVDRLTVTQAARFSGVTPNTIRRWCDTGKLPVTRPDASTHRRIAREDLLRIISGPPAPAPPHGTSGRRAGITLLDTLAEFDERLAEYLPARPDAFAGNEIDRLRRLLGGHLAVDNGTAGLLGMLRALMHDLDGEAEDRNYLQP